MQRVFVTLKTQKYLQKALGWSGPGAASWALAAAFLRTTLGSRSQSAARPWGGVIGLPLGFNSQSVELARLQLCVNL